MKLHLRATGYRHMPSHSVTCHPTQANTSYFKPSQALVLYLPTLEGWKAQLI